MSDTALITDETPQSADNELLDLLYKYSPATLLAGEGIAIILFLALRPFGDPSLLTAWLAAVTFSYVYRLALYFLRKKDYRAINNNSRWYRHYIVSTLYSGICWACLLFFLEHNLSFYHQLMILVALMGMPVASMPNNAIRLQVFYAFALPIMAGLLYWSLYMTGHSSLSFTAMCFAYCAVLLITAHAYQKNLRKALEESMINEKLVNELSSANRKLEEFAYHDPLTGLTNRRLFQDQAEEALARCKRHDRHLALILIDLDNFKEVNDTLGHSAGDHILVTIANRLRSALRLTDPISHLQVGTARFGGDEFIVLLEDIRSHDDINSAARRILGEIRQPLLMESTELKPTCSMGISVYPQNGDNISTLIRRADIALYRVKEAGRDGYQLHGA